MSEESDTAPIRIVHTRPMPWQPSPSPTVWRKRIEHTGDPEKGRVTSVVRYDPQSRFPAHNHPEGEEILVLSGVFSDQTGDYPAGTYLLNPPGFVHTPFSQEGCVIFVKLRQYAGAGRRHIVIQSRDAAWKPHSQPGIEVLPLYHDPAYPEEMQLVRLAPGTQAMERAFPHGGEIFIVSGGFADEHGTYEEGSWARYPAGARLTPMSSQGCTLYLKTDRR